MFRRVLIANRGEIAVRIIRTLREMGITAIAAFSEADREALFVQLADEAYYLGPTPAAQSYLDVDAILAVGREARADAVHPGYGFLAENAAFASAVEKAGHTFIGPSPEAIRLMGNKVEARRIAQDLGVPIVPGTREPVRDLEEALSFAAVAGYPVAVKAAGGGGGRGIRVVERPESMRDALEGAQREAEAYFRNPEVYLERYFSHPRHVEIQVLGDRHGHVVHLAERDCSVQRRHQKLIEETPSPAVTPELRSAMAGMALRIAAQIRYVGSGTLEFLLAEDSSFYFLEMNTRIQVEHPITEAVTGVDIVREMTLAAAGEPLSLSSSVLDLQGHAIEVRVNAEDPLHGFRPTPSTIERYRAPGGVGIRVDSGVYQGYTIPDAYDSLVAKLIAWAPNREAARLRTLRALGEYEIVGPATTLGFAAAVLQHPIFVEGKVSTSFVSEHGAELEGALGPNRVAEDGDVAHATRGEERAYEIEVNRKLFRVRVTELLAKRPVRTRPAAPSRVPSRGDDTVLLSPMHGTIVAVRKQPGDAVQEGETLFVIEAMKMENEVESPRSGTLRAIETRIGETVEVEQRLAVIE